MANVTIPNLPQVTASTDLDILVITDSGETTTSKITKADLLSGLGGAFIRDARGNVLLDGNPATLDLSQSDNSLGLTTFNASTRKLYGDRNLLWGYNSSIDDNRADLAIVLSHYSSAAVGRSFTSTIVGGESHKIANTSLCYQSSIFGGRSNIITQGTRHTVVGGNANNINAGLTSIDDIILGGSGNQMTNDADSSGILAGTSNTMNGGNKGAIIAGTNNQVSGDQNAVVGGQSGLIDSGSSDGAIIGGSTNYVNNVVRSAVIAGSTNTVRGNDAVVIGGQLSEAGGQGSVVIGSNGLTISDQYTTGMDNTYVKSHMTYGTYSGVSIGNEQLFDANNGMVQYFDNPAGNLNIRTVNVKNGEVYDMIIGGAGGVAINSIAANDVGFTAVNNTSAATGSYLHLRIAVVNNLVVFSTL